MLRPLSLLLPLAAFAWGCTHEPIPPSQGLVIESSGTQRPYYHDFGQILDGSAPSHTFRLRNTEPNPVTLHDVLASCSCVVPQVRVVSPTGQITKGSLHSKGPVCVIPPSGFLEIEIQVDTSRIRNKNRDRLSTVRLRTDSTITPFHTLELHVKVQQLIQATPWEIDMGEIAFSEGGRGHTDVVVAVAEPNVNLRTAHTLSPDLSVTLRTEQRLGRSLWIVDAVLEPGLPLGLWSGSLELTVDAPAYDPPERKVVIPVRARIVPDIVLRPRRVFLMRDSLRGAEFTVEALVPGTRFTVTSATLQGFSQGTFTANATPVRPDIQGRSSTWKIQVTPIGPSLTTDRRATLSVTLEDGTLLQAAILAR